MQPLDPRRFYYETYQLNGVFQVRAPIEDYPYTPLDMGYPGFGPLNRRVPDYDGEWTYPVPDYCGYPYLQ